MEAMTNPTEDALSFTHRIKRFGSRPPMKYDTIRDGDDRIFALEAEKARLDTEIEKLREQLDKQ